MEWMGYHFMWWKQSHILSVADITKTYVVEEVFPWGGNSVIFFQFYASISWTGVPLPEIDVWLDPGYLYEFYGALIYHKVEIIVTQRRLQVKWSNHGLWRIGLVFELGFTVSV